MQHDLLKPRARTMEMPGVGALRDVRSLSGRATAESVDGRSYGFSVQGMFRRRYVAVEESGAEVGVYVRERALTREGTLTWYGREYRITQSGSWRRIYALSRADRDLLTLKPYTMGPRRVSSRPTGVEPVEPGLELFCAWLAVRFSQEDATTTSAASAST